MCVCVYEKIVRNCVCLCSCVCLDEVSVDRVLDNNGAREKSSFGIKLNLE